MSLGQHVRSRCVLMAAVAMIGAGLTMARAQGGQSLDKLSQRLIEATGDEYAAVRDEAIGLPAEQREELLRSLHAAPEYSIEQVIALILEARIKHPDAAVRFDTAIQRALDKRGPLSQTGERSHGSYTSREAEETPLVYEELIKLKTPVSVGSTADSLDHLPFILYMAKHEGVGAVAGLITATEGHPEERARLRPIVVELYKEARLAGEIRSIGGVYHMFRYFGTEEDLKIMRELREFDRELLPKQGVVLGDREATKHAWLIAKKDHRQAVEQFRRAESTNASPEEQATLAAAVEVSEQALSEADRLRRDALAWWLINDKVRRLENELAQHEGPAEDHADGADTPEQPD